jgi:hypothetical protein
MFNAKVKTNPANFAINIDNAIADTNLSRKDEWKLCQGINTDG